MQAVTAHKPKAFRYALVYRPAMIGGIPQGLAFETEPRPSHGEPHSETARHGFLLTERSLSAAEIKAFELASVVEREDEESVADAAVADRFARHAESWAHLSREEPASFQDEVGRWLRRASDGVMRSVENIQRFSSLIAAKLGSAAGQGAVAVSPEGSD